MTLLKGIDSIEDVFYGYYQSYERLDIGAKCQSIRYIFTITIFSLLLILCHNLLLSTLLSFFLSTIVMIFLIKISYPLISCEKIKLNFYNQRYLAYSCFPIFISLFLLFYLNNAPKYAIDSLLSQDNQAYYSFIAMPVFVISLLSNFIYQPVLTKIADYLNNQRYENFIKEIIKQITAVCTLTFIVIIGGYFLGIPVLSFLYNTDLALYKVDLVILLIGGGMYALANFLIIVLTTIRKQKQLIGIYIMASIITYFLSYRFVQSYEITGAALTYTLSMTTVALCCLLLFIKNYLKMRRNYDY